MRPLIKAYTLRVRAVHKGQGKKRFCPTPKPTHQLFKILFTSQVLRINFLSVSSRRCAVQPPLTHISSSYLILSKIS